VTFHDDNVHKAKALSRDELERLVVQSWDRSDDRRLRKQATEEDLRYAEAELDGIELARLFDMPTVLDAHVRVEDDDGGVEWKYRDEATLKEHQAQNDYRQRLHLSAAGRYLRKHERLADWASEQAEEFDEAAPMGPYVWREITCCFGDGGYRENDPFEMAHDIAVALGGGDGTTRWAHRSCNRSEGVG
jgi:hypothetical protein